MNPNYHKPFSKLHEKAIREKSLALSLSKRLRNRISRLLYEYNDSIGVQRDPNDRWIDTSDIATEIIPKLYKLYGVDRLEVRENQVERLKPISRDSSSGVIQTMFSISSNFGMTIVPLIGKTLFRRS